jgi:hypothetical protein
MQVPIAVVLDVLFRSPAWLGSVVPAVLTFVGGALILAGFFGINFSSEQEEQEGQVGQARRCHLHMDGFCLAG